MTLQAKIVAALIAAGVVAFGYHERQVGALNAELVAIRATNTRLLAQEAKVDTVFVHDSAVLTRWRTRFDTTRDTLTVHDTTYIVKAVADSAINACYVTLADCRAGWALANARADTLARLLPMLKPPPTWQRWVFGGLGLAAGFFAGRHFK